MERPDCCCSCGSRNVVGPIPQVAQYGRWWKFQDTAELYHCLDCDCFMHRFTATTYDIVPY